MSDIKQLISIIVPVFNERESIGFLLDEVINVMSFHKYKKTIHKLLLISLKRFTLIKKISIN